MRISDWSSDVCSSDLVPCGPVYAIDEIFEDPQYQARGNIAFVQDERAGEVAIPNVGPRLTRTPGRIDSLGPRLGSHNDEILRGMRSEEHTSELQSLMRNSYAVFCLTKTNTQAHNS